MSKRYCMKCFQPIKKNEYGVTLSRDDTNEASYHQSCFGEVNRKKDRVIPILSLDEEEQKKLAEIANENKELKELIIKLLNNE